MEIKLRSISNRIPWWLGCRALLLGAAWLFLPFWVFFFLANYFYWVPFFEVWAFFVPFVLALLLAGTHIPMGALGVAVLFFLILGGKEFVFVHRTKVFETLSIFLLYEWVLVLGALTQNLRGYSLPLSYFWAGAIFFAIRESSRRYAAGHGAGVPGIAVSREGSRRQTLESAVGALLFWEYGVAIGGFPLEILAKDAALFAGAVGFFLLLPFPERQLSRRQFEQYTGILVGVVLIILTTASWTF